MAIVCRFTVLLSFAFGRMFIVCFSYTVMNNKIVNGWPGNKRELRTVTMNAALYINRGFKGNIE